MGPPSPILVYIQSRHCTSESFLYQNILHWFEFLLKHLFLGERHAITQLNDDDDWCRAADWLWRPSCQVSQPTNESGGNETPGLLLLLRVNCNSRCHFSRRGGRLLSAARPIICWRVIYLVTWFLVRLHASVPVPHTYTLSFTTSSFSWSFTSLLLSSPFHAPAIIVLFMQRFGGSII